MFRVQEVGEMTLRRYWFEFSQDRDKALPAGIGIGCGVTAYDYDDAVRLVRDAVFDGRDLPAIANQVTDIDVSDLDASHVRPNMGNVLRRGVWYPLGYE